jgi:hypothetical protein
MGWPELRLGLIGIQMDEMAQSGEALEPEPWSRRRIADFRRESPSFLFGNGRNLFSQTIDLKLGASKRWFFSILARFWRKKERVAGTTAAGGLAPRQTSLTPR